MTYRRTPRRRTSRYSPSYGAPETAATAHIEHFAGWLDWLGRARQSDGSRGSSHNSDRSWAGNSDRSWAGAEWAETLKLAEVGWPEGADRLADLTARLEGKLVNRAAVKLPGYSVVGPGVLDMGRYLMGHPEPFMVWVDADETQDINPDRVLRILANGTVSGGVDHEAIWNRGAAAAVVADLAERQGVRVEIELVFSNASRGHSELYVPLKRAQDHVPAELLAFSLAHPASLRRLAFAVWETLPAAARSDLNVGGTYGHPRDVAADGAIYMPSVHYGDTTFNSSESTAAWIIRTLREHGIEVEKT